MGHNEKKTLDWIVSTAHLLRLILFPFTDEVTKTSLDTMKLLEMTRSSYIYKSLFLTIKEMLLNNNCHKWRWQFTDPILVHHQRRTLFYRLLKLSSKFTPPSIAKSQCWRSQLQKSSCNLYQYFWFLANFLIFH